MKRLMARKAVTLNLLQYVAKENSPNAMLCELVHVGSSLQRNKIMHALVGNAGSLSIAALNVGGLQQVSKRQQLKQLNHDILALSETHLQSHLESSESHQFSDYHCFWGPNSPDRHYSGVALLAKRSSFWHAKKLEWPLEHQCCRFFRDNRLLAVQLWLGTGGVSILVYVVYGMSGARWEASKKTYFHTMFEAIKQDRISRGPIPAVLLGDFNLEITDSYPIRSALQARFWCDTRDKSSTDMQSKTTCHKGKASSKIDHIFVSSNLYDQSFNFQVDSLHEFKDHAIDSFQLKLPKASQVICTLRAVSRLPMIPPPKHTDEPIGSELSTTFQEALAIHDVDTAFKLWSQEFERVLHCAIRRTGQQLECKGTAKRGQILLHEKRTYPKTIREHAGTLQTRKLWKASVKLKKFLSQLLVLAEIERLQICLLCYLGSQMH